MESLGCPAGSSSINAVPMMTCRMHRVAVSMLLAFQPDQHGHVDQSNHIHLCMLHTSQNDDGLAFSRLFLQAVVQSLRLAVLLRTYKGASMHLPGCCSKRTAGHG